MGNKRQEGKRRRAIERKSKGLCEVDGCKKSRENGLSMCNEHALHRRKTKRLRAKLKVKMGMCSKCNSLATSSNSYYCEKHANLQRERTAKRRQRFKLEAFMAYGGAICVCCGETRMEFLSIDHVNGGGGQHRKTIKSTSMYHWLRRQGYPKGYGVLCMNCNFAKGHFGECPHEKERREGLAPPPPASPRNL